MNRIKELREEAGFTQKELATLIGVSDASINKYEKNLMEPKIDKLEKMSTIFVASVPYIMGKSDTRLLDGKIEYAGTWDNLASMMNSRKINFNLKSVSNDNDLAKAVLIYDFEQLNAEGKHEALKQVNNLTKIEDYQK